jgi:uncharacterized NAD-dependent epimerase/dehydratase family protein
MEGAFAEKTGKMGLGVLRFSPLEIVCLVDSQNAGRDAADLTGIPRHVPVVSSIEDARSMGADVLLLGIAPPGGLVPESWFDTLDRAVQLGFSIVNGLHDRLAPRYVLPPLGERWEGGEGMEGAALSAPRSAGLQASGSTHQSQFVWDIRVEPPGLGVGYAEARNLTNKRVLFIGTDMSVGKMTAGLVMWREALAMGIKAEFVATGQIGITITGKGVPLDCVRIDFAAGAIEREVMAVRDAELVLIEGQGSLVHPGSTSTLPLIRGSQPTHLVLCHRAGMSHLPRLPWVKVPDLNRFVALYQDLAEVCGTYRRPEVLGIALNCGHLESDEEARLACEQTERETGLPTTDPVRFGTAKLLERIPRSP